MMLPVVVMTMELSRLAYLTFHTVVPSKILGQSVYRKDGRTCDTNRLCIMVMECEWSVLSESEISLTHPLSKTIRACQSTGEIA